MPGISAVPQINIPHQPSNMAGPVPNIPQEDPALSAPKMPSTAMDSNPAPEQVPQEEDHFDEQSLLNSLGQGGQPQYGDTNAIGTPGQIAQAHIGRNVNEELQIWGKMVGDQNSRIGPDGNVWIKGKEGKFHPADTGHTKFVQDVAKWSGAGIDLTAQALTEIAGIAGGAAAGAVAGPAGAVTGAKMGAIAGWAAGPAVGSASRQFLSSRLYDVTPDKDQLKRDMLIGGSLNVLLGGVFSGMVAPGVRNVVTEYGESAAQRSIKVARAQQATQDFMDTVGAKPAALGEEGIETPLANAGERVYSTVDNLRKELGSNISAAKDQILAADPSRKPVLQKLAGDVRDMLVKNGMRFNEQGMPIPFENIAIRASDEISQVGGRPPLTQEQRIFALPSQQTNIIGTVNEATLRNPLGSEGGAAVLNDMANDYKAMVSGQMGMEDFLNMTRKWQDNADFKVFDQRSDSIRSAWAKLQHQAVVARNGEIATRVKDPDTLAFIQKSYSDYSSKTDAINMVMDAWKKSENSPEAFAKMMVRPGKETLLSQFKELTADDPGVFKQLRSSWVSENMDSHVSPDGIFDAPGFFKSLKDVGRKNLSIMFSPEEMGKIRKASTIMGNIKTSDLVSQGQGQAISDSIADLVKMGQKFDLSKPGTWMNFLKDKPKLAEYVADKGLPELAARNSIEDASKINSVGRSIKNFVTSQRVNGNLDAYNYLLSTAAAPAPNIRGISQEIIRNTSVGEKSIDATGRIIGKTIPASQNLVPNSPMPLPQGSQGSSAADLNRMGQ